MLLLVLQMVVHRRTPWEAFQPIAELEFLCFRDAGKGRSDFNLNIQDCLWGVWKAIQCGLCNFSEFNLDDYEYYEKVENGDWNWITPNFIAFASPVDPSWIKKQKEKNDQGSPNAPRHALERKLPQPFLNCLEYFEQRNVKLVVRLNNELYDRQLFLDRSIDHVELYFDDGTNPTDEIVRKFIDMADEIIEAGGVVAVHVSYPGISAVLVLGTGPLFVVQSWSWANGDPDRSISNLEIWFYCNGGHCLHAYRPSWNSSRPPTTIYVPQATRMGKMGRSRRNEEASSTTDRRPRCCYEGRCPCYSPCRGRRDERGFDNDYHHGTHHKAITTCDSEQTCRCRSGEGGTHISTRPTPQNPINQAEKHKRMGRGGH